MSTVLHYPEIYAKTHKVGLAVDSGNVLKPLEIKEDIQRNEISPCVNSLMSGRCENGHIFYKELVCGREWCIECGKNGSHSHKRRISRWWDKVMGMGSLGYLVVTVPAELRNDFKDKQTLLDLRTYVKRKLQREGLNGKGYDRGLIRYHWAGDCTFCKGKGCEVCQGTGAGSEWKPHLNIFIPEKFVSSVTLEKFRNELGFWFNRRFKARQTEIRKKFPGFAFDGNCHYQYHKEAGKKIHKLKYVTRSTWRFYNFHIAKLLFRFRTSSTWGKFPKSDLPAESELSLLEKKICPCCLKQDGEISMIAWGGLFNVNSFVKYLHLYRRIDAGYYQRKE